MINKFKNFTIKAPGFFVPYFAFEYLHVEFRSNFLFKFLNATQNIDENKLIDQYYSGKLLPAHSVAFLTMDKIISKHTTPINFDVLEIQKLIKEEDICNTVAFTCPHFGSGRWFHRTNTLVGLFLLTQDTSLVQKYFNLQSDERKQFLIDNTLDFFNERDIKERIKHNYQPLPDISQLNNLMLSIKLNQEAPNNSANLIKSKI